jgi:hypothetical protein
MFRLLCLQVEDVEDAVQRHQSASAEEFASALWSLRTRWPPRGQLIVEINSQTNSRGGWFPKQLVCLCEYIFYHYLSAL